MTAEILNIDASADGRRNAYTFRCTPIGQQMHYAACLQRVDATQRPDAPSDWAGCRKACEQGLCPAKGMREEELLKGKSVYFRARQALQEAAEKARTWVDTWKNSKPAGKREKGSVLDAMASIDTSYAKAISGLTTAPVLAPIEVRPEETPLQAARRKLAERKAAATTNH
jgi:hypothetical protein